MRPRAIVCGWLGWVGLVGLLILASAGSRPIQAATCHAPDRPTLGLDRVGFVAPLVAVSRSPVAPIYRPVPCSADPAVQFDQASTLIATVAAVDCGWILFDSGLVRLISAQPAMLAERDTRLDRPPRPV